ncbi:PE family protein [Mycobacterium simiae]|uniref:PE family protein n=1 Tax=Mycobacterium simiae TaxID=1784 RepID=A0A5B1BQ67_MYCSI|nr:PE family protein [Mycobacterium simiae]KAA1249344.1 PE family protein [Mycobacterium simiae]
MSFVTTNPEAVASAAGDVQSIGAAINAANVLAAATTSAVVPAAGDPVSLWTATQFRAHAHLYQVVANQATAIHGRLVAALSTTADSYSSTESANAATAG